MQERIDDVITVQKIVQVGSSMKLYCRENQNLENSQIQLYKTPGKGDCRTENIPTKSV